MALKLLGKVSSKPTNYQKHAKGLFLTIDALLAAIFLTSILFGILLFTSTPRHYIEANQAIAKDALDVLQTLTIANVSSSLTPEIINNTDNLNDTILEQITIFYTSGQQSLANQLATQFLDPLIPQRFGYALNFEGTNITIRNKTFFQTSVADRRLIVSTLSNQTEQGFLSRAWTRTINETKMTGPAFVDLGQIFNDRCLSRQDAFVRVCTIASTPNELAACSAEYAEAGSGDCNLGPDEDVVDSNGVPCALSLNLETDCFNKQVDLGTVQNVPYLSGPYRVVLYVFA